MGKRVDYIDYLRGLSVTWVVWYHTVHPSFVDFSFRIPLFFFISGIFFKEYDWKTFLQKKINKLVVPFVLFYIVYYLYLIVINALKFHTLSTFDFSIFFGVFRCYVGNESFIVNPPLWFICALINLQFIMYFMTYLLKNKYVMFGISLIISYIGLRYYKEIPTAFMFGRSLQYLIYYVSGYLAGKLLIGYINDRTNAFRLSIGCIFVFVLLSVYRTYVPDYLVWLSDYLQVFSVIFCLVIVFKEFYEIPLFLPLKFFGINSYIVLGMHEIFHTSLRIIIENQIGEMTVLWGMVQTVVCLLLLYPTILVLNKYIPELVAKKDLIPITQ